MARDRSASFPRSRRLVLSLAIGLLVGSGCEAPSAGGGAGARRRVKTLPDVVHMAFAYAEERLERLPIRIRIADGAGLRAPTPGDAASIVAGQAGHDGLGGDLAAGTELPNPVPTGYYVVLELNER